MSSIDAKPGPDDSTDKKKSEPAAPDLLDVRPLGTVLQAVEEGTVQPKNDTQDAGRHFLDEFVADSTKARRRKEVPGVPAEAQVAKFNDDKKDKVEKPTPEELARTQAEKSKAAAFAVLTDLHKELRYTADPSAKLIELAPNDNYQPRPNQTATQIATEKLGKTVSPAQFTAFRDRILSLNGLSKDGGDKPLGPLEKLRLPGMSSDGAIVSRSVDTTTKVWQDGSILEETERGTGSISYKSSDLKVTVKWNPDSSSGTSELRENKNTRSLRFADGDIKESSRRVEKTKDPAGKEIETEKWETSRTATRDEQKRSVVKLYGPGEELKTVEVTDDKFKISVSKVADKEFAGTRRTIDDAIVDDNYRINLSGIGSKNLTFFSRQSLEGGGTKDTFEDDKGVQIRNKDGQVISETFTDDWGRRVEKFFGEPAQILADRIVVTPKEGAAIEFKLGDFGDYWGQAKFKPENGPEFEAKIHRRGSGLLVYNQGDTQSWAELKDGTKMHKSKIMANFKDDSLSVELKEKLIGGQKVVQRKDGETLTQYLDKSGTRAKDIYDAPKDSPVSKIVRTFQSDGQTFSGITVTQKSGEEISLTYDRKTGLYRDIDTKQTSETLSKAYYFNNKLFLTAPNSAEYREIDMPIRSGNLLGAKQKEGKYDHQLGVISTPQKDGSVKIESLSSGREDIVKDGKITGKTMLGERSTVDPGKETVVYNRDGSKLQFKPGENRISYWGPTGEPTGSEVLNADEQKYYNEQPDIQKDPRDFAELHRLYVGRESELKSIYGALVGFEENLKQAVANQKLTAPEASALRKNILHDLTHTEDMDQQQMGSCNVEVVRREMALNVPARYVTTFSNGLIGKVMVAEKEDLAEGAYTNAKPVDKLTKVVPVDVNVLKTPDSTGRNLAARMFDNLAIEATIHPKMTWHPTPDGVGAYIPKDATQDQDTFEGMWMGQIATCLSRLTGVKRTVVNVEDVKELSSALTANGGRSLIIAVEAGSNPVAAPRPVAGEFTNHVITLIKIDEASDKAWFQNNWGQEHDRSTTPVSAKSLLDNMVSLTEVSETSHKQSRTVKWKTPGQCIGPGEPGKVYRVNKGVLEEDPRYVLTEEGREILK